MTLPSGYKADLLYPKILIHDKDGNLVYTYESEQIATTPTQDITLEAGNLHAGLNDDHGSLELIFIDKTLALTDSTDRKSPLIKNQYTVQLYLGKDSSSLERWFYGMVIDTSILKSNTGFQRCHILCAGWGHRLAERYSNIRRFQKKTADGLTLDDTDNTAKASELVKDVIEDTDHLAWTGLGTLSEITLNGVEDIDHKLADLQENMQSFAHVISRLAGQTGAYWGVDYDRDLFFRLPNTSDSYFLFTNDLGSVIFQNWDTDKVGIIKKGNSLEWSDSSAESGYSVLNGYGSSVDEIDIQQTTENASHDGSTYYIGAKFVPNQFNIQKIGIKVKRFGTLTDDLTIRITGGTTTPTVSDLRKRVVIKADKLNTLSDSSYEWLEVGMDKVSVTVGETLFVLLDKHGDSSNHIEWSYNAGTGDYVDSTNGTSWTVRTGLGTQTLRTYPTRSINHLLINTEAERKFGIREKTIVLRDSPSDKTARETLIGLSDVLGRVKRAYSPIRISPTSSRIPLGKFCLLKDKDGLSVYADIVSYDLSFSAFDQNGVSEISLNLQEWK